MRPYEGLLDSHFHLAQVQEPLAVLSELEKGGFAGGMAICLCEDDLEAAEDILSSMERPLPALLVSFGMGPWETEDPEAATDALVARIRRARERWGFSVLGEFGLDLHWPSYGPLGRQTELFEAQLALAREFGMPVVIHSRDAEARTLQILRGWDNPLGGIIHCFSYDAAAALAFAELGYHVSFAGNITYKHSENLAEALRALPPESLLLETDSPYLAPSPFRGRKNDPRHMREIYAFAAGILDTSVEKLALRVLENFNDLARRCPGARKG